MHTEEEAKGKWCPFVKVDVRPFDWDQYNCIASECMAWRWANTFLNADGFELPVSTYSEGEPGAVFSGYCGLSGEQG